MAVAFRNDVLIPNQHATMVLAAYVGNRIIEITKLWKATTYHLTAREAFFIVSKMLTASLKLGLPLPPIWENYIKIQKTVFPSFSVTVSRATIFSVVTDMINNLVTAERLLTDASPAALAEACTTFTALANDVEALFDEAEQKCPR